MAVLPSRFGDLAAAQNLQALIDNSQEALNSQSVWRNYLSLGVPQATLTFEAVVGRHRLEAAASIVDPDSKKPIRSRAQMDTYTGKIPSIQQKMPMNQADFRSLMLLESLMPDASDRKREMIRLLFDDVSKAAVAPDKRLDIMLLQGISTLQIDVNATNNPDGVNYGTVDLLSNSFQKQGVPAVWSDTVNSDPFRDIENFVMKMKGRGRSYGKIEMSLELWMNVKRNAKIANALSVQFTGKASQQVLVTLDTVNDYLVKNKLPQIDIIDYSVGIETDGVMNTYRPFDAENVVFRPLGIIGELKNAIAVEDQFRAQHVTYAKYDRTLVSKWMENDPVREWTGCELNAFPAIDIESVAILTTDTVQASFN